MRFLFSLLILFTVPLHGLVLEKIDLDQTISGKKIAYYSGSFDPLHLGHQDIAREVIKQGLAEYVIAVPSWGGDTYKKRVDVQHRLDMLFAAFADDPHVIVTRLNPHELQKLLTVENQTGYVDPKFDGTEFVGLIGSDTAQYLAPNMEALETFMTGKIIEDQHKTHTLGGLMAIPAQSFIVALREGDTLESLQGRIGERPIEAVIESPNYKDASSTKVKKTLRESGDIIPMVGIPIAEIIKSRQLYE